MVVSTTAGVVLHENVLYTHSVCCGCCAYIHISRNVWADGVYVCLSVFVCVCLCVFVYLFVCDLCVCVCVIEYYLEQCTDVTNTN